MKRFQTKLCPHLDLQLPSGSCSCQMRQEKVGFTSCSCHRVTPAPKSTFSEDLSLLMGDTPYENHLKIRPELFESSWPGSCWICVFKDYSERVTGSWVPSHSADTQWCLLKAVFFIGSVSWAVCIYVPGFCLQLLGHILTLSCATDNVESCVCFVPSWCFLVNRNEKLLVLTADKVNSVVQGQHAGCSPLLKDVLHQMLPLLFSVQSLPVLFSGRRNCWLALMV